MVEATTQTPALAPRVPTHAALMPSLTPLFPNDQEKSRASSLDFLRGGLFTFYLQIVLYILHPRRTLRPRLKLGRMLRRAFVRAAHPSEMKNFLHNGGHCYTAPIDGRIASDCDGLSHVCVFEDGEPLPAPHADHQAIRDKGLGRYSHWAGDIFFSTSDNSDPRTNGRRYTYCEMPVDSDENSSDEN